MPELSWQDLYPYESRWFTTKRGHRIHYVDKGNGVPVVIIGGMLGWSFQFRNLLRYLVDDRHRVILVDHLGFGPSDKPVDYEYTLENHIGNLAGLLKELQLPRFHLIIHGTGGPVGLGFAAEHIEKIRRIVLLNTPCFPGVPFMAGLWLMRFPGFRRLIFQKSSYYIKHHLKNAFTQSLPDTVRDGYLAPYLEPEDRIPFLNNLENYCALNQGGSDSVLLNEIALQFRLLSDRAILCVGGEKDPIFYPKSYLRWQKVLPNALVLAFPKVGHFLLEDLPGEIIPLIGRFIG